MKAKDYIQKIEEDEEMSINEQIPDAFAFKDKKGGYITISRHEKPDFVFGMTKEQINKRFNVVPVYFTNPVPREEKVASEKEGKSDSIDVSIPKSSGNQDKKCVCGKSGVHTGTQKCLDSINQDKYVTTEQIESQKIYDDYGFNRRYNAKQQWISREEHEKEINFYLKEIKGYNEIIEAKNKLLDEKDKEIKELQGLLKANNKMFKQYQRENDSLKKQLRELQELYQ